MEYDAPGRLTGAIPWQAEWNTREAAITIKREGYKQSTDEDGENSVICQETA